MLCKICGTENVSHAMFCENCGAKFEVGVPFESEESKENSGAEADFDGIVKEEIYEGTEEVPKKSKSVRVLVIIIVVLAMLVCGTLGTLLAMNYGGMIEILDGSSSTGQQVVPADEEDEEEEEEEEKELTECEELVEEVLKAVENENPSVVKEQLGFECGDSKSLSEKMAKTIADEFEIDYSKLTESCEKVTKSYFDGMESRIKNSEKISGDYLITASFTRLDKEKILNNILDFDADNFVEDMKEDSEISEEEIENALTEKIAELIEGEMSGAELVKDELEFLVANDDGEWFIYIGESDFEVMEKELTIEE